MTYSLSLYYLLSISFIFHSHLTTEFVYRFKRFSQLGSDSIPESNTSSALCIFVKAGLSQTRKHITFIPNKDPDSVSLVFRNITEGSKVFF